MFLQNLLFTVLSSTIICVKKQVNRLTVLSQGLFVVKLIDVAQAAGVSKAAVSYAFSSDPVKRGKLSAATRERILAVAAKFNYQPNLLGQAFARQKSYNIALLMPESCTSNMSGHYLGIFHGVSSAIAGLEYNLSVFFGCGEKFLASVRQGRIDGVAVLARQSSSAVFEKLALLERPVVFLNRTAPDCCPAAGSCCSDYNVWLEQLLAEYLQRGIKKCVLYYREGRSSDSEVRAIFEKLCKVYELEAAIFKRDDFRDVEAAQGDSAVIFCGSSPLIREKMERRSDLNYAMLSTPETNRHGIFHAENLYYHNSKEIGRMGVDLLLSMIDKHSEPCRIRVPLVQKYIGISGEKSIFEF